MARVSVLLPVYNDAKNVAQSVRSILEQTFQDFELLIVDDGSTDDTRQIVSTFDDCRVRIIVNERNLGLAPTLNRAIAAANGEYLSRQDADDIALPHRLETQVTFLDSQPEIAMLGSRALLIDENGNVFGSRDHPCADLDIKWNLLFYNPFVHSSVTLRRSVLDKTGVYSEDPEIFRAFVEDYELWSRINQVAKSANTPERLLKYRVSSTSASSRTFTQQLRGVTAISQRNICRLLGWESVDMDSWRGLQKFWYQPARQRIDFTSAEVKRTIEFLTAIHEAFCRTYGLANREAAEHRRRLYWPWGRHAVALSYRWNGRRDLRCRIALLTSGVKLSLQAFRHSFPKFSLRQRF